MASLRVGAFGCRLRRKFAGNVVFFTWLSISGLSCSGNSTRGNMPVNDLLQILILHHTHQDLIYHHLYRASILNVFHPIPVLRIIVSYVRRYHSNQGLDSMNKSLRHPLGELTLCTESCGWRYSHASIWLSAEKSNDEGRSFDFSYSALAHRFQEWTGRLDGRRQ